MASVEVDLSLGENNNRNDLLRQDLDSSFKNHEDCEEKPNVGVHLATIFRSLDIPEIEVSNLLMTNI